MGIEHVTVYATQQDLDCSRRMMGRRVLNVQDSPNQCDGKDDEYEKAGRRGKADC